MNNSKTDEHNEKQKAVALKYDQDKNDAPQIVAKGRHEIAKKIINNAEKNNIPIYEDEALIENLIKLELESEIPEELYQVVAEVLSFIYQLNEEY